MASELALPYVPIDPRIERHPKTRKLLRALGLADDAFAHMHVVKFLMEVGGLHPDGKLGNLEPEDVADMARWRGDAKAFTDAMCDAGWLMFGTGGYVVVGWEDYGGQVFAKREAFRERQALNGKSGGRPRNPEKPKITQPSFSETQNNPPLENGNPEKLKVKGEGEGEGEVKQVNTTVELALDGAVVLPANQPPAAAPEKRSGEVLAVFEHYRRHHPRAHPKPSSKSQEWRKIRARLDEGYSADDLKKAIDGCHVSPFHCGENDRGKAYQSLELIVRDASKVNQFLELAEQHANGPPPVLSERERRGVRAGQQWLERMRQRDEQQAGAGHDTG